jgi:hypothetical protein
VKATSCCVLPAYSAGVKVEARTAISGPPSPTRARRCLAAGGWILPSSILALLPKCPACIAAYIAVASGIGISATTAIYFRIALIILCAVGIAHYVARRCRPDPSNRN